MNAKSLILVVLAGLVTLPGVAGPPADRSKVPTKNGKPVYEQELLPLTASTFEELYGTSEEVLDVQVTTSEVRGVGTAPFVRTLYTATVLRPIKAALQKGQTVVFSQGTGELELPDRILRAGGGAPLAVGERYIVFLGRNATFGRALMGEREGAFKVRDGRIDPQGSGSLSETQRDLSERQFIDELERIARHAKPRA